MGSHGGDQTMVSGNDAAACSETTVEIKIKMLDSRTFTLRVDKCVPVPQLKQQIATVTGVLSEQQRLICRGKVLKDDQLLSAYQVEDGHTLHLVERPPFAPGQESSSDNQASGSGHDSGSRTGPEVLVGTFNLSEPSDGYFSDLSRILSSVLATVGVTRFGGDTEGFDLNQPPLERAATVSDLNNARNSSRLQTELRAGTDVPMENLQPPVIPDSLTTLSQYLSNLRQEFLSIGQSTSSQNAGSSLRNVQNLESVGPSMETRGVLAPESLAEVMSSSRQLLVEQASECLLQLARQLAHHSEVTDPLERSRIQSNAMRSGTIFQNLGALFLELGRTVMTLRMGQTPADALVNAGPSVFVSSTGPNPIMVQQLPFQLGTSSASVPSGAGPSSSAGSLGSGLRSRNIDIRIRTGSLLPRRESTVSQPQTQVPQESSTTVNTGQQNVPRPDSNTQSQGPQLRAYPRGSIGIIYPVLSRVGNASGNSVGVRASQAADQLHNPNISNREQHRVPSSATQQPQSTAIPVGNGNNSFPADAHNEQGFSIPTVGGLEQLFNAMFPMDQLFSEPMSPGLNESHHEAAHDSGNSQETSEAVTDEGLFLSNVLRQLLPFVSENEPNLQSTEEENSIETQVDDTTDQGASSSSRHRHGSESQSNPKRQRRE